MPFEYYAPMSGATSTRLVTLEDKYVRTTRFASIGSGTSGTVTLPPNSEVVLDDFGGATDAVVSVISASKPTFTSPLTAGGAVVATSFDSSGNYTLTGTPSAYPVAIIYRVRQKLKDFDSTSTDILGIPTIFSSSSAGWTVSGTRASPNLITTVLGNTSATKLKIFVAGSGGASTDPTIANGSGTDELLIFTTHATNTVELNSTSNLQLSGKWIGVSGSMLFLQWDGGSKWVEVDRNEI